MLLGICYAAFATRENTNPLRIHLAFAAFVSFCEVFFSYNAGMNVSRSIAGLKRLLLIALALALPVEAINLTFLAPPLDVGYADGTPWYVQWIGLQWVLLHLPALWWFTNWLGQAGLQQWNVPALFLTGYIETVLVLTAAMVVLRLTWKYVFRTA